MVLRLMRMHSMLGFGRANEKFNEQVHVGTKMRLSDFFGDGTDAFEDGNELEVSREPHVIIHLVPIHSRSSRACFSGF